MTTRIKPPQCLTLAAILAVSVGILWSYLSLYVLAPFRVSMGEYQDLEIQRNGTPVLRSWGFDKEKEEPCMILKTLDGKEIKPAKPVGFAMASQVSPVDWDESSFDGVPYKQRVSKVCDSTVERIIPTRRRSNAWWYFLHDGHLDGRGYFVGYDSCTNLTMGYIGRDGFCAEAPPPDKQFPIDGRRAANGRMFLEGNGPVSFDFDIGSPVSSWNAGNRVRTTHGLYLLDDEGLVKIRLEDGTVRRVWRGHEPVSATVVAKTSPKKKKKEENEDLDPIAGEMTFEEEPKFDPSQFVLLLRFHDRVLVADLDGKPLVTCPIPEKLRDLSLNWLQFADNRALAYTSTWWFDVTELYWYDPAGKIVRHESVDMRTPPTAEEKDSMRRFSARSFLGTAAPCGALAAWIDYDSLGADEQPAAPWAVLTIAAGIVLVWPALCYRRQRRFGLRSTWMWMLFVLLFGLPGYFGYVFHRRWPLRRPCPHCRRRVPRDRTVCCACGREFPLPPAKGIEVFA